MQADVPVKVEKRYHSFVVLPCSFAVPSLAFAVFTSLDYPPDSTYIVSMNICLRLTIPFLLALYAGCASTPSQQSAASKQQPNLATVYFYRTHYAAGGAVNFDIQDNGIDLGALQDGSYFVYHALPGQHTFTLVTDTTAQRTLKLQAGATYYVEANVSRSGQNFLPSLKVVFDLQGQAAVQNLRRLNYQE